MLGPEAASRKYLIRVLQATRLMACYGLKSYKSPSITKEGESVNLIDWKTIPCLLRDVRLLYRTVSIRNALVGAAITLELCAKQKLLDCPVRCLASDI